VKWSRRIYILHFMQGSPPRIKSTGSRSRQQRDMPCTLWNWQWTNREERLLIHHLFSCVEFLRMQRVSRNRYPIRWHLQSQLNQMLSSDNAYHIKCSPAWNRWTWRSQELTKVVHLDSFWVSLWLLNVLSRWGIIKLCLWSGHHIQVGRCHAFNFMQSAD
jgi:hypothetical protein